MTKEFWLSSEKMTFWCKTENEIIVDVAPIAKKFIGQDIRNLFRWMKKQGNFLWSELKI
jgi:hypothetical protein